MRVSNGSADVLVTRVGAIVVRTVLAGVLVAWPVIICVQGRVDRTRFALSELDGTDV